MHNYVDFSKIAFCFILASMLSVVCEDSAHMIYSDGTEIEIQGNLGLKSSIKRFVNYSLHSGTPDINDRW